MKAFKQINLRTETRIVWSTAVALCFASFFIVLSPIFAQDEVNPQPDVKIDVKKEYDDQGRLVKIDSARTWCWSGKHFTQEQVDSIMEKMHHGFDHFYHGFEDRFNHLHFPDFSPFENYWDFDGTDSTVTHPFENFFNEDFFSRFHHFEPPTFPGHWDFPLNDSTGISFFDYDSFEEYFEENHKDRFDDFKLRFDEYHKEHQKLIEKYFGEPIQEEKEENGTRPKESNQEQSPVNKSKTGTI